jgi:hypothetical protein
MPRFVDDRTASPVSRAFKTLDELREIAIANGCTPAQFDNAVETVGANANALAIARYLKRHSFLPDTFKLQET